MVIFTFIRHGESTDNTRHIWAGWKDAPLSNHGMNQAQALGNAFVNTKFSAIHSSDLQRAFMTAHAILEKQNHRPPLTTSSLLREQCYGIAEGHPHRKARLTGLSLEDHFSRGVFPVLYNRSEKFPDGESLDDLARRAQHAIQEIVLPYVMQAAKEGATDKHVAIISHGLFISEAVVALLLLDASGRDKFTGRYQGLHNTGWVRVKIGVKGAQQGFPVTLKTSTCPPLYIQLLAYDRHAHLEHIVRQGGGIGSAAYDSKQKDIRSYFDGCAARR